MQQFFIDGSSKGLTIGYGIVQIDAFGFMKLHEGHTFHANGDSEIAELYALEKAIDLVTSQKIVNPRIVVDRFTTEGYFRHVVSHYQTSFSKVIEMDVKHFSYINAIRNKINRYYDSFDFSVPPMELVVSKKDAIQEEIIYMNTAHTLSRTYLNNVNSLFTDDETPLKSAAQGSKEQINALAKPIAFTVNPSSNKEVYIDVTFEDGIYTSFHNGQKIITTKYAINVVSYTIDTIKRACPDEEFKYKFFSVKCSLFKVIKKSIENENCPEDLRTKADIIFERLSKKELSLTSKL